MVSSGVLLHRRRLPRLDRQAYRGCAIVHWTLTVHARSTGWLDESFHARFREVLIHACARYALVCPAYCLMPDHGHVLWIGTGASSDQKVAVEFLRRHTRAALAPHRWQQQAYDHVLRAAEREHGAFARTAWYVLENPVRAGLAASPEAYAFSGAAIPGYPELSPFLADYWQLFWRLTASLQGQDREQ